MMLDRVCWKTICNH